MATEAGAPTLRRSAWSLTQRTAAIGWRYRVTGLAAEAAFFALISLPPLILGLVGSIGYVADRLEPNVVDRLREYLLTGSATFLTPEVVDDLVKPLLDDVLTRGRADFTVLGIAITLWAGSRSLNVFIDTISIMHGHGGRRGPLHIRALSFAMYLVALVVGIIVLPLLVIGPSWLTRTFPEAGNAVDLLYWPVVSLLAIPFLATLDHVSVPDPSYRWRRALPGAALAFVLWVAFAFLLRIYLGALFSGASVYGGFAAPVAVLFFGYLTALAVLIGAALNAAIGELWPVPGRAEFGPVARGVAASAAPAPLPAPAPAPAPD